MYKKVLHVIIIVSCCGLTSCLNIYHNDLGKHYAWLEDRIIVRITEETEKSLSYDLIIRPQVLNYAYDDRYIIAYQVYDGGDYYDTCQRVEEKDSLFLQFAKLRQMKFCYWIINKETGEVLGPMNRSDFDRKCRILHVEAEMFRFSEKSFWKG